MVDAPATKKTILYYYSESFGKDSGLYKLVQQSNDQDQNHRKSNPTTVGIGEKVLRTDINHDIMLPHAPNLSISNCVCIT